MELISWLREESKKSPAKIILPEGEDERVLKAADYIKREGIAEVILLDKKNIDEEEVKELSREFYRLRKHKLKNLDEAIQIVKHPVFYAAMMVKTARADGFVAGAINTTSLVARAAIQCLGAKEPCRLACAGFIMIIPSCAYGENGIFLFADCALIPQPTAEQLAKIAVISGEFFQDFLNIEARIAFLSYSTKGSGKGVSVEKVKEALALAREMNSRFKMDGTFQADAALIPEVARRKGVTSQVAGRANILIFPDLDSGNISYKLVERLSKARAIGPLLLGLNEPCSDLSRGCNVDTIIDCVAITSLRARKK